MNPTQQSPSPGPSRAAMTVRYVGALLLFGTLTTAEYVVIDRLVEAQQDRARLVERIDRQRMLVHRTALLSQRMVTARDSVSASSMRTLLLRSADHLRALHDSIAHTDGSYERLVERTFSADATAGRALFRVGQALHRQLSAVDRLAGWPESGPSDERRLLAETVIEGSGSTSELYERLIRRLAEGADREIGHIRNLSMLMLVGTWIGLALVGLLIFDPMVRGIVEKRRALQEVNSTLVQLSTRDGLTGAANRRSFDDRIREEWGRAARAGRPLALLLLDIDHFKLYNDRHGHQAGDECLQLLTRDIQARLRRPADFVARYGGEEFAVVLPETGPAGARVVAEDLRRRTLALALPNEGSPVEPVVTISVGAAAVVPGPDHSGVQDLVGAADRALYRAKGEGRNRVVVESAEATSGEGERKEKGADQAAPSRM